MFGRFVGTLRSDFGRGWRPVADGTAPDKPWIRRLELNVVILGVITKGVVIALGCLTTLLLALWRFAEAGARRRLVLQVAFTPSVFSSLARIETRRLIHSPSRAPPNMIYRRSLLTPGQLGRE